MVSGSNMCVMENSRYFALDSKHLISGTIAMLKAKDVLGSNSASTEIL